MAKSKVEQINDAFMEILVKENAKKYSKYLKEINKQLIENVETLTASKVKSIISSVKLDIDDIVMLLMLQSAILIVIDKRIPRKKLDKSLLPLLAVVGMYSLKRPKRFVQKIVKIQKTISLQKVTKLSPNENKTRDIFKEWFKGNDKNIDRFRKMAIERTEISIVKSKRNKRMLRDFKRLRQEGKGIEDIKRSLTRKYNKRVNIERVLNTELHSQSVMVKHETNKISGAKYKTWKQRSRPSKRHTKFHEGVINKRIPIDSDFQANGLKAQYPGDDRLPASDVINCGCWLEYESVFGKH
jgi:hypothetical protein